MFSQQVTTLQMGLEQETTITGVRALTTVLLINFYIVKREKDKISFLKKKNKINAHSSTQIQYGDKVYQFSG